MILTAFAASCVPLAGSPPDAPAPSHPPVSAGPPSSSSTQAAPVSPAPQDSQDAAGPPAFWKGEALIFRDRDHLVRFRPIGPWTRLAPASDASFPVRNLIFALIAPNGDTLRFMFVAQNDWGMPKGNSEPGPWSTCPPGFGGLASVTGAKPRCFLFSQGCLVARVATLQLSPDWRIFIEFRRDLAQAGRSCRDWSRPDELDQSGRKTLGDLIRRADGSFEVVF